MAFQILQNYKGTTSKDLSTVCYSYKDDNICIDKPELVWNCNCYLKEYAWDETQIPPCPIHNDLILGEKIPKAYTKDVIFEFDKLRVRWTAGQGTRPSIDSFRILSKINDKELNLKGLKILDYCSGSGILGMYCMLKGATVAFYDKNIIEYANMTKSSRLTWFRKKIEIEGINQDTLTKSRFDMIVSNPPYFNSFNKRSIITKEFQVCSHFSDYNPLDYFYKNKKKAKTAIVSISLASEWAKKFIDANDIQVLGEFKIPLRVPMLYHKSNRTYLKQLERTGSIIKDDMGLHPYRHLVYVILIDLNSG